jgi:hypothetical protein
MPFCRRMGGVVGSSGRDPRPGLLPQVRQEREQGLIGTKHFASQHQAQYGGISLIAMGARWVQARAPLCWTPLTGTMVRVRAPQVV